MRTVAPVRRFTSLLALAGCALAVSGCGGSAKRDSVNRYFRQVDDVQRELVPQLARVNLANRRFSLKPRAAKREVRALTQAERSIRLLRTRLAALDPPTDARRVHRLLLRLLDLEVTTAHELRGTAVYLPASQRALAPLAQANVSFRRRFAAATGAVAQAAALDEYAAGVARTDGTFRRLLPPALLRPSYDAQLATLVRVRALAVRLAAALRTRDGVAVSRLVPQFRAGASTASDYGAAQTRAIRRYNARVREISRTSGAIRRERERLQQRFG